MKNDSEGINSKMLHILGESEYSTVTEIPPQKMLSREAAQFDQCASEAPRAKVINFCVIQVERKRNLVSYFDLLDKYSSVICIANEFSVLIEAPQVMFG